MGTGTSGLEQSYAAACCNGGPNQEQIDMQLRYEQLDTNRRNKKKKRKSRTGNNANQSIPKTHNQDLKNIEITLTNALKTSIEGEFTELEHTDTEPDFDDFPFEDEYTHKVITPYSI